MVTIFGQVGITLVVWIRRGDYPSLLPRYVAEISNPRYSIQRYARKINGRVFGEQTIYLSNFARLRGCTAVNYRLAPQYPFPCAIQDLLAACEELVLPNPTQQIYHIVDLFLIQPPPDAAHRPVKPEHIVIAGDSAGGGISLALLQVIRDAGLPQPAGGVLISPWCDLTHSFPSVRDNTATVRVVFYSEQRNSSIHE